MTRKTNTFCILQVDERLLALLRVRRSLRGVEVLDFEQERGSWSVQDGSLETAVKEFVKRHRVHEEAVFTVLPRHEMTARILTLPSQDLSELGNMVRLSAEEFVPFPVRELVMDQCVLQKLPDGQSRVLAVFVHRDVVETHLRLLRSARIEPQQVYVSSACLASAAIEAHSEPSGRFAVVNVAPGGLEVLVLAERRLVYTRGVAFVERETAPPSVPDQTAGVSADTLEELAVEVRASLSAYQRESEESAGVEHVYVCSEWPDTEAIAAGLSSGIDCSCSAAAFMCSLITKGAEKVAKLPVVALGAALAAQGRAAISISLVPESLVRARERKALKRAAIRLGALAGAVLVSLTCLYGQAVYHRQSYIRELKARIEAVRPTAESVEAKEKQLMTLQRQVDRTGTACELLARLCELSPSQGLAITRYSFVHREGIRVEVRADSVVEVDHFAEGLRQSRVPHFSQARQGDSQQVMEQDRTVIQCEIQIPFPSAPGSGEEGTPGA